MMLRTKQPGREIFGKIASGGTVSIGATEVTAAKTATGVYEVTLNNKSKREMILKSIVPYASVIPNISAKDETSFEITFKDAATGLVDTDSAFDFCVVAFDNALEY